MRLDGLSILKATAWGLLIAVLDSLVFHLVDLPILEAICTVALAGVIGFLFGRISLRTGGSDGFGAMAAGGSLAAIVPAALVWAASAGIDRVSAGGLRFDVLPGGLITGAIVGGLVGAAVGAIGGLIYASRI
jgi:hypothetical protein